MTDKHWYPRYVGDYARDTSHLSLAEHGAYTLLLDHYYSMKGRVPAFAEHLHRVCRAVAPSEQEAVDNIVKHFFLQKDGLLINSRADKELKKRKNISEKRANAAITMHYKKHANAPANASNLHSIVHDTATATDNKKNPSGKKNIPVEEVTLEMVAKWSGENIPPEIDLKHELAKFKTHAWKGKAPPDGVKAFQNWLLKAVEFHKRDNPTRKQREANANFTVWGKK